MLHSKRLLLLLRANALKLTVHSLLSCWMDYTHMHALHTFTHIKLYLSMITIFYQKKVIKHIRFYLLRLTTHTHTNTHHCPFQFHNSRSYHTISVHNALPQYLHTPTTTHNPQIHTPPVPFTHCLSSLNNLNWSILLTTITL